MASDDNEKWELPPELRIDNPAVKVQSDQMRRDLEKRAVSPFARLSPKEFARIRAQARIEHLTSALREIEQRLSVERGRVAHHNLRAARTALRTRLAENLAVLEQWALAADIHPDEAHRQEYLKKINREVFNHL